MSKYVENALLVLTYAIHQGQFTLEEKPMKTGYRRQHFEPDVHPSGLQFVVQVEIEHPMSGITEGLRDSLSLVSHSSCEPEWLC
jgi:hypothetical protein